MSHGSTEPETDRDRRCEHCGRYYTRRGIISHRRNCQWEAYDVLHPEAEPLEDDGGDPSVSGTDPNDEPADGVGDTPTPEGGAPDGQTADTGSSGPTQETATDGGPRDPPMPDVDDVQKESDDEPTDLPDHLVPVDEYLEAVRESDAPVDVSALEEQLAEYSVVDVEETTTENIEAYRPGEVPSA